MENTVSENPVPPLETPKDFYKLSNYIGDLSEGISQCIPDWIDLIYIRENISDGSVLVTFSSMDEEARKSEFSFVLVSGKEFSLEQIGGRKFPKDWNAVLLHRLLIEFLKQMSSWQPVYAIKFSPFMRKGQKYTKEDLLVSEFLSPEKGWVLSIRGVGNGFGD